MGAAWRTDPARAAVAAVACAVLGAGCGATAPRGHLPVSGRPTASSPAASTRATRGGKHADFLTGVSCMSAASCLASGWFYDNSAGPAGTLAERWNGRDWQALALPAAAGRGRLTGISCAAPDACMAAGSPVLRWNGASWRVALRTSVFTAVSCPAASWCAVAGATSAEPGAARALAGIWDGRSWRITPVPRLPHRAQAVTVAGLSCWAPDGCLAVGDYSYGAAARPSPAYRDRTLAAVWNGSRWRLLPSLAGPRRQRFTAVSCPAPRACLAVGSAGGEVTLAALWSGGTWHAERTPDFGAAGYSELTGIWCGEVTRCVAVGDYDLAVPYSEILAGGRWRVLRMALPAGLQGVQDLAVSCAGRGCEATGAVAGQVLAERLAGLTGRTWRLQAVPAPG